jgi:hypothetical protein
LHIPSQPVRCSLRMQRRLVRQLWQSQTAFLLCGIRMGHYGRTSRIPHVQMTGSARPPPVQQCTPILPLQTHPEGVSLITSRRTVTALSATAYQHSLVNIVRPPMAQDRPHRKVFLSLPARLNRKTTCQRSVICSVCPQASLVMHRRIQHIAASVTTGRPRAPKIARIRLAPRRHLWMIVARPWPLLR